MLSFVPISSRKFLHFSYRSFDNISNFISRLTRSTISLNYTFIRANLNPKLFTFFASWLRQHYQLRFVVDPTPPFSFKWYFHSCQSQPEVSHHFSYYELDNINNCVSLSSVSRREQRPRLQRRGRPRYLSNFLQPCGSICSTNVPSGKFLDLFTRYRCYW